MTTQENTLSLKLLSTELTEEGILNVKLDVPDESMNVLRLDLIEEFEQVFDQVDTDSAIKGMVFTSAKPDSFIAGADIAMIQAAETAEEAAALAEKLQQATLRIERCKKTTVVAVHGACLGGGLELAMAFDYRIATSDSKTVFALPEVQLGLLPGGSGTQRLPRMIDLPLSLDMMLTGKRLNSKRAKRAGLIDDVVAQSILLRVANEFANKSKARPRKRSITQKLMNSGPARAFIFKKAREQTLAKTKGNYPAPPEIIDRVEYGLANGREAGLKAESKGFGELAMTTQSQQLQNLFFATTELKKDSGIDSDETGREVSKVGILGAGLMGAGIAYVSMKNADSQVRLKDRDYQGVERGISYVNKILQGRVKRRRMTSLQKRQLQSLLTGTTDYSGFANTQLVVEAVFESLDLKQQMVADIEALEGNKEIIFATNTSAIPIADIAAKAKHPERVIGMHYFSPVEKMPLLEIITTPKTADWVTATCVEYGKQQGKTVIAVNDGPGFYTTRILGPYIMESIHLIMEGVAIEDIDKALEDAGFPVGPITLLDEVGIDVASHIAETLHEAFGERAAPVPSMQNVIGDDRKGRKNSRGFYIYEKRKKGEDKRVDMSVYPLLGGKEPGSSSLTSEQIAERCLLQMVNEAALCLEEGILRNARDGDIGAVFGLGFPPFLGGPFRYVDQREAKSIVAAMQELEKELGPRFKAADSLVKMAESGERFY